MTKCIRIENADTSNWKVWIRVELLNEKGEWIDSGQDATRLDHPTQMSEQWIHGGKRLIVEEHS